MGLRRRITSGLDKRLIAMTLLAVCGCVTASSLAGEPARHEFQAIRMGVPFSIVVYAADEAVASAAVDEAFRKIRQLDTTLSDYNPNSELNRLVATAPHAEFQPVSDDLFHVFDQAERFSELSGGGFDVTVGPAVQLWRRAWRTKERPAPAALKQATASIGYHFIQVDRQKRQARLTRSGMKVDLGGIAKGYACDQAIAILKRHGIDSALVEGGGDLACGNPPPGKQGWTVAVEALSVAQQPESPAEPLYVTVANCGVATSGDAYQFIEFDGVRYSHIVDPKSGVGLTCRSSATVIAENGTAADALASAASVVGPDAALTMIDRVPDAALLIVSVDQQGVRQERRSAGFEALLSK